MSLFVYEAIDARGRLRKGEIEAPSVHHARHDLKAKGLVPRKIEHVERLASERKARRFRPLGPQELISFFESLGTLLDAGMPLDEALAFVAESMDSSHARHLVSNMRQYVLEGSSLNYAMQQCGFPEIANNMVAAGEETGQLALVARRLAELLERQRQLRQDLLSAALYPAIVTLFSFLAMIFLMVVVVPQVVGVFSRTGGELPWLTMALIQLSEWIRKDGPFLLLFLGSIFVAYRLLIRIHAWRVARDRLLLRTPWIGEILRKLETARVSRTLGMLLAGGVPALPALEISSQSSALIPIRQAIKRAEQSLREGGSLSVELEVSGCMPHLATRMIAVGEQSGNLDAMLLRVADYFEKDVSRGLQRFVTLLEPLLVMLMALMVGSIALAILLPIMEMNELIR